MSPPASPPQGADATAGAAQQEKRTVLHHLLQEFDDDLGCRPDEHLALAALLRIEDTAQAVVQHRHPHHGCRVGELRHVGERRKHALPSSPVKLASRAVIHMNEL
jgi:hypothetical protein